MSIRKNRRYRKLASETLEGRSLFAGLTSFEGGGFCPMYSAESDGIKAEPIASLSPSLASASSKGGTTNSTLGYSVTGNRGNSTAIPRSGLALMGGGTNVNAAFQFLVDHANKGDFVILSFSTNSMAKTISALGELDSVESFVIPDKVAANATLLSTQVAAAEAIFITGGDQSNYINYWKDTALETAIYTALGRGAAIGGSSAGLAVLGDVDYAALNDSTTSAEALANPATPSITLDDKFLTPDELPSSSSVSHPLRFMSQILTDSHFMQRDRMGRTMAFMANADVQNLVSGFPIGLAINEQTALLVEADGSSRVVGNDYANKGTFDAQQRSVYVMTTTTEAVVSRDPLNYEVKVLRLNFDPRAGGHRDTFSFPNLAAIFTNNGIIDNAQVDGDMYTVTAKAGDLSAKLLNNAVVGLYGPFIV